jgi:hypothetical protein
MKINSVRARLIFIFFFFHSGLLLKAADIPSLKKITSKVESLVKAYYPESKILATDSEIEFEYKTRDYDVYEPRKDGGSDYLSKKGPEKGGAGKGASGIIGRMKIKPGPYMASRTRPQTVDYHYFKELLLAPYSKKKDFHIETELLYPESVDPKFVEEFTNLINGFENEI